MDALRGFVSEIVRHGLAQGNWLGLVNLLIGRRIDKADGSRVSSGNTWREVAALLKKLRWKKDAVRDAGLDAKDLPPRDRQQYWFLAIARAQIDSPEARAAGDRLAEKLRQLGYVVSDAAKPK